MAARRKPTNVEIRTYQVGFGDCFLVTFKYPSFDRHVLIDFGSMRVPEGGRTAHLTKVAKQIKEDCGGRLDVVVATHRHADHVNGFATNKRGTGPGDVIAACKPKVVIQPWTENPRAAKDAKTADMRAVQAFINTLDHMHGVAEGAVRAARALRGAANTEVIRQLDYLGQDGISNRAAVENLMTMAKNYYVNYGDRLPVRRLLPGVKVHVLGPPSLRQSADISTQRRRDAEEFWHLQAKASDWAGTGGHVLFPDAVSETTPLAARWFRRRMQRLRADNWLSIVRILDRQMNNTSLILLFEVAGKFLLFPGDAQIENWHYALDQPAARTLLRKVGVYKVGHHGSLNATPKTLWGLFARRGAAGKRGRLKSLLSTLDGVHGDEDAGTEVPRSKLVDALRQDTDLLTTESFEETEISRVVRL